MLDRAIQKKDDLIGRPMGGLFRLQLAKPWPTFLEISASIWNFRRCLRWPRIGGQKDKSADFAHLAPPAINDLDAADGQILVVASYFVAVPPSKVCTFRAVSRTFYKISAHIGDQGVNRESWHRITLQM